MPVTIPEVEPTVAIVAEPDTHVPPGVAFVSVMDEPSHIPDVPSTAAGMVFTVTVCIVRHPVLTSL
jgi:hypothetical protein